MGTWIAHAGGPGGRGRGKVAALIVAVLVLQARIGIHPACVITGLGHLAEGFNIGIH